MLPFCKRKMFLRAWITLCMLLSAISPENIDDNLSNCEVEALLKQLTNPSQEYQLHAAALRNQLRNLIENEQIENYQSVDPFTEEFTESDKRSLSSLAREGLLVRPIGGGKRYLGALARSEMFRPSSGYAFLKRSLATLAKNGQLPSSSQEPDTSDDESTQQWEGKRNLGALARSGYIISGKRNIGSLARDYQLPSNGKRNLAALARLGFVPSTTPKRNMASLARMNLLPSTNSYTAKREAKYWPAEEKKNIGALKNSPVHGKRQKRSYYRGTLTDDNLEIPEEVYQNAPLDYEELKDSLDRVYGVIGGAGGGRGAIVGQYLSENPQEEKRFLGSVAKSGWLNSQTIDKRNIGSLARLGLLRSSLISDYGGSQRTTDLGGGADGDSYFQQEQKRHIGALARSGWLPAFRSVRSGRFSRSGRARSQIVGYYPQQERLRQPIAAVCRRCNDVQLQNTISWGAPGLQTTWGTPPRLTALHWRSLRPTGYY